MHCVNVMAYLYKFSQNEEELEALQFYSSFILVVTSALRKVSDFTTSGMLINWAEWWDGVLTDLLRIQPYQHSIAAPINNKSDCDVTRLVATEHVRKKYWPLKSSCC